LQQLKIAAGVRDGIQPVEAIEKVMTPDRDIPQLANDPALIQFLTHDFLEAS
jgi:hypothetical protein